MHGTNAIFSLDNAAGSLQALTAYVESLNPEMMQAMHDISVLGNVAINKTVGLKDGKLSVNFIDDATGTIITQLTAMYAAQTPGSATTWSIVIGPRGSTSTFQKWTAECFLTSLPIPLQVNEVIKFTVQLEIHNGWTFTTY